METTYRVLLKLFFLGALLIYPINSHAQLTPDFGAPGKQTGRAYFRQFWDVLPESKNGRPATQMDGFVFLPVYQNQDSTYGFTAKGQHLHINDMDSAKNFEPVSDLHSSQYGVAWSHKDQEDNVWGFSGSYGSASDKPFEGANVSKVDMTLTKKFETSPTTSWILFLNYSNNRAVLNNVPLPLFAYVFSDKKYPGIPEINLNTIDENSFFIGDIPVIPIMVWHLKMPVLAFRFGNFTYVTDANRIEETEREKIKGSDVMVINALRHKEHISHFSLSEAVQVVKELQVPQAYITHISHQLGLHDEVSKGLPDGIQLAYDGLQVTMS